MPTQRANPYGAFNFIVTIGGDTIAAFQEVSGLDSENTPMEYREGADPMNTTRKLPGMEGQDLATKVSTRPKNTLVPNPYSNRAVMSRPAASVPSQCCPPGTAGSATRAK